jgi:hypothetical protein
MSEIKEQSPFEQLSALGFSEVSFTDQNSESKREVSAYIAPPETGIPATILLPDEKGNSRVYLIIPKGRENADKIASVFENPGFVTTKNFISNFYHSEITFNGAQPLREPEDYSVLVQQQDRMSVESLASSREELRKAAEEKKKTFLTGPSKAFATPFNGKGSRKGF